MKSKHKFKGSVGSFMATCPTQVLDPLTTAGQNQTGTESEGQQWKLTCLENINDINSMGQPSGLKQSHTDMPFEPLAPLATPLEAKILAQDL